MQNKLFLSEIDKKYQELLETLSPEQEEVITEYCNAIFSSGADTELLFTPFSATRFAGLLPMNSNQMISLIYSNAKTDKLRFYCFSYEKIL